MYYTSLDLLVAATLPSNDPKTKPQPNVLHQELGNSVMEVLLDLFVHGTSLANIFSLYLDIRLCSQKVTALDYETR